MTAAIFKREEDDQPSDEKRPDRVRSGPGEGRRTGREAAGPARRTSGGSSPSVIGPGTTVVGSITMEDDLQVDGRLDGSVSTEGSVTVTDRGTVEGDIEAAEVVVSGRVDGTIRAEQVARFRSGCRVKADVHTPSITVEEGGVVDGRLSMAGSERQAGAAKAAAGGSSGASGSSGSPGSSGGSRSPSASGGSGGSGSGTAGGSGGSGSGGSGGSRSGGSGGSDGSGGSGTGSASSDRGASGKKAS